MRGAFAVSCLLTLTLAHGATRTPEEGNSFWANSYLTPNNNDDLVQSVSNVQLAWHGTNAISYNWNAGTESWFTASNWMPSGLPGSSDNIAINNGGNAQVLSGNATANIIYLGQVTGNTGNLTLGGTGILSATQIAHGTGAGAMNFDGGTLRAMGGGIDLLASFSTNRMTSELKVSANNAYLDTNGFSVSVNASLTGAGALVKRGEGTLTLTGDNTSLLGGVRVEKGILAITGTLGLYPANVILSPANGDAANLTVSSGGLLSAASVTLQSDIGATSSATISGGQISAIGLHVAGKGDTSLTISDGILGTESLGIGDAAGTTGTFNVNGGSVSSNYAGIKVGSGNGGTGVLNLTAGSVSGGNSVGLSGAGSSINISGGTFSGGINVGAAAVLNLSGGSLISRTDSDLSGTANLSGGSWDLVSSGYNLNILEGGTLNLSGGSLLIGTDHNSVFLFSNETSKATLNIGTGGSAGSLSAYRVSGAGIVNFNHTGLVAFHPKLEGTMVVNKLGSGTTSLTAASTYSGGTNVSSGVLLVSNTSGSATGSGAVTVATGATLGGVGSIRGAVTIQSGATIAPGALAGRLTLGDSLTLASGANLSIELGGILAGSGYDQLLVSGALSFTGSNLNIVLLSGFLPELNQKFFILDNTAMQPTNGVFANAVDGLVSDPFGHTFAVNYQDSDPSDPGLTRLNDISLTYVGVRAVPEPGTNFLILFSATALLFFSAKSRRRSRLR